MGERRTSRLLPEDRDMASDDRDTILASVAALGVIAGEIEGAASLLGAVPLQREAAKIREVAQNLSALVDAVEGDTFKVPGEVAAEVLADNGGDAFNALGDVGEEIAGIILDTLLESGWVYDSLLNGWEAEAYELSPGDNDVIRDFLKSNPGLSPLESGAEAAKLAEWVLAAVRSGLADAVAEVKTR